MLLRDLQPASFRGVTFLCPRDELHEGRQVIDHLYPDSSVRYAEDNGKIPAEFKISAILCEPGLPGKVKSLREALTRPGPGTLRHPWCGSQFVQVNGKVSYKRDDKHAGVIEIEIPFLLTGPPVFPGIASGIAAVVSGLASSTVLQAFTDFAALYAMPSNSAAVISGAIDSIGQALLTSFGASSAAPAVIVSDAGLLAAEPARLGNLVTQATKGPFEDSGVTDQALVRGFSSLSDVADDVAVDAAAIVPTTIDLAMRRAALDLLATTIDVTAFAGLADAVAGRKYTTADDVERDETLLVVRHDTLMGRDLSAETRDLVQRTFVAASEVLRDVAVRLPRVQAMPITNIPASVLAYMLTGTDADEQAIVDLNLEQTPLLLAGDVNVLTV